jgi:hypothetical protein
MLDLAWAITRHPALAKALTAAWPRCPFAPSISTEGGLSGEFDVVVMKGSWSVKVKVKVLELIDAIFKPAQDHYNTHT